MSILSQHLPPAEEIAPAEPQSAVLQLLPLVAENITPEPTEMSTGGNSPSDQPLQANFTFGQGNTAETYSVQFLDTSTGRPVQWKWDFDDGKQSAEQNPLHVFLFGGLHRVTLTVLDAADNMSSTEQNITLEDVPNYAAHQGDYLLPSTDDGGAAREFSSVPTAAPTETVVTPTPTETQTAEPTISPTEEETQTPVVTEVPTTEPTVEPTAEPTEEPTPVLTEVPTAEPTEEPTPVPTEVPTAEPTPVPTEVPTPVPTQESPALPP
jgi:PKD repeat protein